jgi:hypothetical protein
MLESNLNSPGSGKVFVLRHPNLNADDEITSLLKNEDDKERYELEPFATTSQMYHAAILNGTILDDLLAGFELSDGKHNIDDTGRIIDDAPSEEAYTQYQNSSIQNTPEGALTRRRPSDQYQTTLKTESDLHDRFYGELVKTGIVEEEDNSGAKHFNSGTDSRDVPKTASGQTYGCENGCNGGEACPTFARRHAQSRLPQRARPDTKKQSQDSGKPRPFSSIVGSDMDLLSKRNRLQRRSRVQ